MHIDSKASSRQYNLTRKKKIIITRHVSFCILLDTDKKADILIFVKLY